MQEVFIEVSKAVFAICDSESMYIYNLMEYVHSRKGEEFEVQAFTGVESLCACAKEKTIEILLISGKLLCEQGTAYPQSYGSFRRRADLRTVGIFRSL